MKFKPFTCPKKQKRVEWEDEKPSSSSFLPSIITHSKPRLRSTYQHSTHALEDQLIAINNEKKDEERQSAKLKVQHDNKKLSLFRQIKDNSITKKEAASMLNMPQSTFKDHYTIL